MANSMIGHNGPPTFDSAADLPPDLPKMHNFVCDIAGLRKSILDKPLEVRGFYISVLLAMYDHMEGLPTDEAVSQLRTGIRDVRTYRRLLKILVDAGLVYIRPSGRVSNVRFEDEITAYVADTRRRQKAALEQHERARQQRQKTAVNLPNFNLTASEKRQPISDSRLTAPQSSPELRPNLEADLPEKTQRNQQNAGCKSTCTSTASALSDKQLSSAYTSGELRANIGPDLSEKTQQNQQNDEWKSSATRARALLVNTRIKVSEEVVREVSEVSKKKKERLLSFSAISATQTDPPCQTSPSNSVDLFGEAAPQIDRFAEQVPTAVAMYNDVARRVGLPVAAKLTAERAAACAARLKEYAAEGGIDAWRKALANLEASKFCQGKNDRNWKANFDFLCNPKKFMKVYEGAYLYGDSPADAKAREAAKLKAMFARMR